MLLPVECMLSHSTSFYDLPFQRQKKRKNHKIVITLNYSVRVSSGNTYSKINNLVF